MIRILLMTAVVLTVSANVFAADIAVGTWGSIAHSGAANLVVTADGARLEPGCGGVSVDGAISVQDDGSFEVSGTTFSGLMTPPGHKFQGNPAILAGKVAGNTLVLTVIEAVKGSGGSFGATTVHYTLKRGAPAVFPHCL